MPGDRNPGGAIHVRVLPGVRSMSDIVVIRYPGFLPTHPVKEISIMHGGGTAGFNTQIAFDPDKRVGFVMLSNTSAFGDDIGLDFLRRGLPLAIPEVESRDVLARYVGLYEVAPSRTFVVRMEDDGP